MTKIFGENYLSLLRYNADQFSFLEIKSLQTALTGDHLLVGWRPMGGRLPQCLSRFLVVSSVLKETCLPFSDSCRPPVGPESESRRKETPVQLSEHNFFAGQQNQKPDLAV